jgi:hypothetical protein
MRKGKTIMNTKHNQVTKKIKIVLATAALALCVNSRPALDRLSPAPQPAYAAILGSGQSLAGQIAIGVALGVAAGVIGVATGGAGAIAAGALAGA